MSLGAAASIAGLWPAEAATVPVFPGKTWATRTPAQVGLNATKLNDFVKATGGKAGVIIKDGYLIKTWGAYNKKMEWASASKPVLTLMTWWAVKEGKLGSVDALVKDQDWPLIAKDQPMTYRHLANMVSGYALPEAPAARWAYSDYGIRLYYLSLYTKVFKAKPNAVIRASSRLGPLQFQDGALFGTARGGYGLITSPRDFARVGLFWLNRGKWKGIQRLPRSFFDAFMKTQVPGNLPRSAGANTPPSGADYLKIGSIGGGANQEFPGQGRYGFNWWFNPNKNTWPDAPADTIQARGHNNGESLFIIPSWGMVVAMRANNGTFQNAFAQANGWLKILGQARK